MERKPWTQQEDLALKGLVDQIGLSNWTLVGVKLSKACVGSERMGKQCRERWLNHLDIKISKKPWTKSEQKIIFQMHNALGNKWKEIAKHLKARFWPNLFRTQNDIKNHFYATMRKGIRRLNKLIGFKKDPSQIRRIKPAVISNVCEQQQRIQLIPAQRLEIQGIFNLILKLSRTDPTGQKYDQYIQNEELISTIENFLQKLLKANRLYQQSKDIKKIQKKNRRCSMIQFKSQQINYGFDISEYLCLGLEVNDSEEMRPKSMGAQKNITSMSSEYDIDSLNYLSQKEMKQKSTQ